jgi:hypothetical protein
MIWIDLLRIVLFLSDSGLGAAAAFFGRPERPAG